MATIHASCQKGVETKKAPSQTTEINQQNLINLQLQRGSLPRLPLEWSSVGFDVSPSLQSKGCPYVEELDRLATKP